MGGDLRTRRKLLTTYVIEYRDNHAENTNPVSFIDKKLGNPYFFVVVENMEYNMSQKKGLTASLEDYLEAIFHIISTQKVARSKEIAARLKVRSSSVTGALHALSDRGLVNYVPYGVVTLTDAGEKVAKDIVRRHEVLKEFFTRVLAVDEIIADEGACEMEHSVPKQVLERFVQFIEFVETCPRGGIALLEGFGRHCAQENDLKDCKKCVRMAVAEIDRRLFRLESEDGPRYLSDLKPGQKAMILSVQGDLEVQARLESTGLTSGSLVEMEKAGSHSSPLLIKLKGYHIPIPWYDAQRVTVEAI